MVDFVEKYPKFAQISLPWQQGSAHNILHGSIESAIPENSMLGANISGLSAILAKLYAFLCPNFVAMVTRVGPKTLYMVSLNRPFPKTPY